MNEPYAMVSWNLAACARHYHVTIREIAKHMGITLKRVREIRDSAEIRAITAWDCVQAIKEIAQAKTGKGGA